MFLFYEWRNFYVMRTEISDSNKNIYSVISSAATRATLEMMYGIKPSIWKVSKDGVAIAESIVGTFKCVESGVTFLFTNFGMMSIGIVDGHPFVDRKFAKSLPDISISTDRGSDNVMKVHSVSINFNGELYIFTFDTISSTFERIDTMLSTWVAKIYSVFNCS